VLVNAFGLKFKGITQEKLFDRFDEKCKFIVTVNSEFIVEAHKNKAFKKIICENFATFDGQIPYILAKCKLSDTKFEKISGSDLIFEAIKYCELNKKRIFYLGGTESTNKAAVSETNKILKDRCIGYSPPFSDFPFDKKVNDRIISKIEDFKPHFVFVGFGAIKQELWIEQNFSALESIGVNMIVGSGGSFSFVSNEIQRAPVFIQKAGLEGVFRLIKEPKIFRFKRLLKSLLVFKYFFTK